MACECWFWPCTAPGKAKIARHCPATPSKPRLQPCQHWVRIMKVNQTHSFVNTVVWSAFPATRLSASLNFSSGSELAASSSVVQWCVRLASRRSTHKRSHKHYKQHLQEQHPDQAAPAVLFSKSKRTKAGGRRTVHDGHSLEAPVSRAAASAAAPALLGVGSSDSNEELGASNSGQQQTAAMFPGGGWLNDQRSK